MTKKSKVTVTNEGPLEVTREMQIQADLNSIDHALKDCVDTEVAADKRLIELKGSMNKLRQKKIALATQQRLLNLAKEELLSKLEEESE